MNYNHVTLKAYQSRCYLMRVMWVPVLCWSWWDAMWAAGECVTIEARGGRHTGITCILFRYITRIIHTIRACFFSYFTMSTIEFIIQD